MTAAPATPSRPPRRLLVLLVVGGCITVAAALGAGGGTDRRSDARTAAQAIAAAAPTVADPDALSTTWYCAEGTSAPGSRANQTILIANVGEREARADVTVMPGGQGDPRSERVTVPEGAQVRVPVSNVLPATEQPDETGLLVGPGVAVETFGGQSVVEHQIDAGGDIAVGPCARQAGRDWYFAAGTTERGADQNAALFNPFADDAIVDVTFATDGGFIAPADLQSLFVPHRSRVIVPIGNFVRRQAQVATHVHARTGRVVAERSLLFTAENETRRGLTLSPGATGPAVSWSLPGVVPEAGASHTVVVANFDTAATEVEVTARFESATTSTPRPVPVGARSTAVVDLSSFSGSGVPFTVDVRATRASPVVVEELAWWAPPAIGAGSATVLASPVRAPGWAFATGLVSPEVDATVSVFNPGRNRTTVNLLAYAPGGSKEPTGRQALAVPAGKQARFNLAELGVTPDQVVVVRADALVVAVRRILGSTGASLATGAATP